MKIGVVGVGVVGRAVLGYNQRLVDVTQGIGIGEPNAVVSNVIASTSPV